MLSITRYESSEDVVFACQFLAVELNMRRPAETPGIYTFWRGRDCVYVGRSGNLRQRLNNGHPRRKEMPDCIVKWLPCQNHKQVERWLIEKLRPSGNGLLGGKRTATSFKKLNATTIEKDADPEVGELVEVDIPDIGRERFLRVRCGTGRRFALPVPPEMTTALQANCWTYGIDETEFNPEVRT